MKIDKSILKSIYPNHGRLSVKLIENLGIEIISFNEYRITNADTFSKNFWSKLSEEQKVSLFLTQLVEYDESINELKNSLRTIEDRLDNLKITY
jgi:hypothetical protein